MPGWAHASVTQNAAEKAQIAGQKVSRMFGFFRDRKNGRDQLIVHPFIGIQMQLPGPGNGQVVDRPIALRAIVLKGMLDDGGSEAARQFCGSVLAERVDDKDFVGNPTGARKRGAERILRVERQKDDGWPHNNDGSARARREPDPATTRKSASSKPGR